MLHQVTGFSEEALITFLQAAPKLSQIDLVRASPISGELFETLGRLPNSWKTVEVESEDRLSISTAALVSFLQSPSVRNLSNFDSLQQCCSHRCSSWSFLCISLQDIPPVALYRRRIYQR